MYGYTVKCIQTDHITPTQKMSLCDYVVLQPSPHYSLMGPCLVASLSPPERGSASTTLSVAWLGLIWHLMLLLRQRQWHLQLDTVADLEGKTKARTSVTVRTQADCFFSDSLAPRSQLYSFSCHYLKFLILSLFSFSRNLSASLIVKLPACSCALLCSLPPPTLCVCSSLARQAKLQLPENMTGTD